MSRNGPGDYIGEFLEWTFWRELLAGEFCREIFGLDLIGAEGFN